MQDKKPFALIGICLLAFIAFLEYTIVTTSLPAIQIAFKVNVLELQWVFNIYCIMLTSFMMISGRLGDILGRRLIFYTGAVLLALGSLGAGAAWSIGSLIFFRAIQSIGVATVVTLAPTLLYAIYDNAVHRPMSIYGTVLGIALASGPVIGGWIVMHWGWRWIFFINIPLLAIAMAFCLPFIQESKVNTKAALDITGAFLVVIVLSTLIYGIIHGEQTSWTNLITISMLILFVISTLLLIVVENRQAKPVINFRFFKKPKFVLAAIGSATGGTLITLSLFFSPLFLQRVMNYTPKEAGLILLTIPVAIIFFAPFVGKLVKTIGTNKTLFIIPVLAFFSSILHLIFAYNHHTIIIALIAFFIIGFSWTLINIVAAMGAAEAVPPEESGVAIGTAYSLWSILAAIHLAITTVLFHIAYTAHVSLGQIPAFIIGFKVVFIYAVVISILLVACSALALFYAKEMPKI